MTAESSPSLAPGSPPAPDRRPGRPSMEAAGSIRSAPALARRLPDAIAPLAAVAYNYWWCWNHQAAALFAQLDPIRWESCGHNPTQLLEGLALPEGRTEQRLATRVERVLADFDHYLGAPGRPARVAHDRPIAFFCAEYGIHRSLPIYSGGLGVLAGDLLKEASDQDVPLVAVGLLYRQGYCHQRIDAGGRQQEHWITTEPETLPITPVTSGGEAPTTVTVTIGEREVVVQAWRVEVGRVSLFLLDTDHPANQPVDRWITARLYVGDRRLRLAQYMVLGVGGVRMLRALGVDLGGVHLNEGHAALAPLELAREGMAEGLAFDEALAAARERTLFTTHTPVPAGNDVFTDAELDDVMGGYVAGLGIGMEELRRLGRVRPGDRGEPFGVTPLALRCSRVANGVSRRHGVVARQMWADVEDEDGRPRAPIGHITNGVHVATWMSHPMRELLDRHLPRGWIGRVDDRASWEALAKVPDDELWAVRRRLRAELVAHLRERVCVEALARGASADAAGRAAAGLDPEVLLVGLARRMAVYKRASLILRDPDWLAGLLGGPRPVQFLVAGKAHPQDEAAKQVAADIFGFEVRPEARGRVVLLEDYDMALAVRLVAGCDVWLNVPRPPMEASGTSGMKAALNGGVNLSVLDGWWEEGFEAGNGWGIASRPSDDPDAQDRADAETLYKVLEREVAPLFYERDEAGVPAGWLRTVRRSMSTVAPRFSMSRVLQDYLREGYEVVTSR